MQMLLVRTSAVQVPHAALLQTEHESRVLFPLHAVTLLSDTFDVLHLEQACLLLQLQLSLFSFCSSLEDQRTVDSAPWQVPE